MEKKMYAINPIVKLPQNLLLSDVMHNVKTHFALPENIKETYYENASPNLCHTKSVKSEAASDLIVRQEKILETLKKIKEKLINLQQDHRPNEDFITSTKAISKTSVPDNEFESLKSGVIQDVVVCSDSMHPPYFLLALKNLLGPRLRVCLSSTVHSSSSQVDQNTLNLFQDKNLRDRRDFNVAFTVIWKNQKFKSLMVNPLTQCAITGEGNILRYLSRLSPRTSPLNYESGDLPEVTEVDYWLDLIQMKLLHGNNKEQQNALKQLNSKLGSSDWLNGKQFGVCDIFLWSVLKQLDPQLSSSAPSNVGSWMKKISKIAEFDIDILNDTESESYANPKEKKIEEKTIIKKHFSRGDLEKFFNENGIKFQSRNHKEVFTVDTLMDEVGDMPGLHMKNLFLKDKKKNLYLLCARHDSKINLNDVAKKIGAKELRFADENTLKDVLGVTQGCVTLYALVNDPENRVHILLDSEAIKNDVYEFVNFHPLMNSSTLGISPKDLGKFLELVGHKTTVLDI